ncbi:hypothetical protein EDC18_103431 [Natranaerovirga pectinivora]|uniref:DUF2225 domain-containing protein n=1 Tax=Natranaerovirga pectinivora TaxID=682400 RepID=A0A4R3MQ12_9FIRM|nr:DUF2225 domain-containing protein [Natranaerovirga pectinivora]TCT15719.1 hypothetical protein EDC18_103431 [Natranaerovirga pectinivora]
MKNLFSELEQLGLSQLGNIQIYKQEEEEERHLEELKMKETDIVYDRSYMCPVCDKQFKSKAVKTGKARLKSTDTDLRPVYDYIDPIKYDAVVCPSCGYAAMNRFFTNITDLQRKWIREQISVNFKGLAQDNDIYDYEEALKRYKLALINAVVKKGKLSEKAYTCLKITWLLRGKEALIRNKELPIIESLKKQELEFAKKAYEGFSQAFGKESFPICGMDEITVTYLIGELARRTGNDEEALRWLSKVITSRAANERIKDRAREVKNIIKKEQEKIAES